jgi:hypothetical protein
VSLPDVQLLDAFRDFDGLDGVLHLMPSLMLTGSCCIEHPGCGLGLFRSPALSEAAGCAPPWRDGVNAYQRVLPPCVPGRLRVNRHTGDAKL